jgi:hypothetical protein
VTFFLLIALEEQDNTLHDFWGVTIIIFPPSARLNGGTFGLQTGE